MVYETKVEKKSLREIVRKKLTSLTREEFEELSNKVSKNLFAFLNNQNVIQEKIQIGAFAPFDKEPIWFKSFDISKLQLSFPSEGHEQNQMCFRISKYDELYEKNDFGSKILGPRMECEEVVPSLILIPGIAFNLRGERLGRGKGYFDRYLDEFSGLKVGLCFELQLLEKVPTDPHDVKVDWLITEKNIYKIP